MNLTQALLSPLPPAKPLITHYDDQAGTRIELSTATTLNWAAKTANWLTEEHDITPGSTVAINLPPHWQTATILLGAWWTGAHIVGTDADITFITPDQAPGPKTATVSLDPMGRDLGGSTPTRTDFIAESRLFGDDFYGEEVPNTAPALANLTIGEILNHPNDLPQGTRLLSTHPWTVPTGILKALIAPLRVQGSLVQVTNPTNLDKHRQSERTTADLI
ncbi:TIGR03089 family protein [Actinokineospora enzanensis]|uniref:TIGR03089 family protein n=1 Tax=Actinokineospora enzanensis TaxID=155975 RepID=UPI0004756934|nr:TIGR03089 family protein [Actinokineospora enzanensis]